MPGWVFQPGGIINGCKGIVWLLNLMGGAFLLPFLLHFSTPIPFFSSMITFSKGVVKRFCILYLANFDSFFVIALPKAAKLWYNRRIPEY